MVEGEKGKEMSTTTDQATYLRERVRRASEIDGGFDPFCSWCLKERDIAPNPGESHGICNSHLAQEREKLRQIRAERADRMMAAEPDIEWPLWVKMI